MEEDNSVFGLTTIRRNRGITLEQISEATKISMRSLRAIESGDFKKLPGGIYNTNYIRQYARAIDFSEADLLAYYYKKTGAREDAAASPDRNGGKGIFGTIRSAATILGL